WRSDEAIRAARGRLGQSEQGRLIGLMPGSRAQEIQNLLPAILQAATRLHAADPALRFLLPIADARHRDRIEKAVAASGLGAHVRLTDGATRDAMLAADMLIVASGTATLEAALLGVPMVIVYKLSPVTI